MITRVVFDTSTLIGAALKDGSIPHRALLFAIEFCTLCGSNQTMAELAEVLNRDYFSRRLSQPDRVRFFELIRENTEMIPVPETTTQSLDPPCRDANDSFILALANAAQAEAIISSDQDLLVLHPWQSILILTPAQFVAQSTLGEWS